MAPTASLDYLQLTYRPDLQMLVCRWMRQPTTPEMQQGYMALLAAAEAHQCHLWLVDVRRRDHGNQQGVGWMMEVFFPQVAARLGKQTFLAYLFAPTHLHDIETDPAVPLLTYFDGRPYRVARFTDEQQAMEWLAACRQPLPATRTAQ